MNNYKVVIYRTVRERLDHAAEADCATEALALAQDFARHADQSYWEGTILDEKYEIEIAK
jgi:hypothetical protein